MRDYGKDSAQDDNTNISESLNVQGHHWKKRSNPALSRHNAFDSAAETQPLMTA